MPETLDKAVNLRQLAMATAVKYSKPDGGIPESDLSQAVKDKLDAAPDLATVDTCMAIIDELV